jgi:hypothetical protein
LFGLAIFIPGAFLTLIGLTNQTEPPHDLENALLRILGCVVMAGGGYLMWLGLQPAEKSEKNDKT